MPAADGGVLVRCGTVPAHCWVTDWFEHASFGIALFVHAPLERGLRRHPARSADRPDWVLRLIGVFSLITAVYAAGMAVIQRDERRFFAHLFLSHASLVLVGLELHTELSLCASLCLWFSVNPLARWLRPDAAGAGGPVWPALADRLPRAVRPYADAGHLFLLTGLASVGFPGTLGFISTELLVESVDRGRPLRGDRRARRLGPQRDRSPAGLFAAIYRCQARLIDLAGHRSARAVCGADTVGADPRCGGLFPQPGVATREHAAVAILKDREVRRSQAAQAMHVRPRRSTNPSKRGSPNVRLHKSHSRLTIGLPTAGGGVRFPRGQS